MDKRETTFIGKIKDFMEVQNDCFEMMEEYFEFIRYRNITKKGDIERLLDTILGMSQTNKTTDLYTRVCLYYHAIDKEAAMDYAQYYLEMYNDDTVFRKVIDTEKQLKLYIKK